MASFKIKRNLEVIRANMMNSSPCLVWGMIHHTVVLTVKLGEFEIGLAHFLDKYIYKYIQNTFNNSTEQFNPSLSFKRNVKCQKTKMLFFPLQQYDKLFVKE